MNSPIPRTGFLMVMTPPPSPTPLGPRESGDPGGGQVIKGKFPVLSPELGSRACPEIHTSDIRFHNWGIYDIR